MGRTIATVLVTMVVFILVLILGGAVFIYSGAYNVAANESTAGLIRWILLTTADQSIARHAEAAAPLELSSDSTVLRRGFSAFEDMCIQCHGAPGVDRGWIGQGVEPTPPYLHEEASDMSDAELFWVIRHGVKFTAMPALQPTHTDEQIRELAAFVKLLPAMEETEYAAWRRATGAASSEGDTTSAPNGHVHDDGHDHVH